MKKYITKEFKKENLKDMANEDSNKLERIEETIESQSRWEIHFSAVFREVSTGKFYVTEYSKGATECQDTELYEFEDDVIICREVKKVKKTIEVFEAIEKG